MTRNELMRYDFASLFARKGYAYFTTGADYLKKTLDDEKGKQDKVYVIPATENKAK